MERRLNHAHVRVTAEKAGHNFTSLAREVGVSVESVSKWLTGRAVPRPGKALRLSRVLGLSYDDMFGAREVAADPRIAFRITRGRAPKVGHRERALSMARLYEHLVPYLGFDEFKAPLQLKSPSDDYDYLDGLSQHLRRDMGCALTGPLSLTQVFEHLSTQLQAVVVPVFWSHRKGEAELAMHVYSPKTRTTWIPFNLETKAFDALFWLSHELAHAYTWELMTDEDRSEAFADAFAGSLVVPAAIAKDAYEQVSSARDKVSRYRIIFEVAQRMAVSPVCVAKQVERYSSAKGQPTVKVDEPGMYAATTKMSQPTVAAQLFTSETPEVEELLLVSQTVLKTPFFKALSGYLKKTDGGPAFIQGLLDCPLADAKALHSALA